MAEDDNNVLSGKIVNILSIDFDIIMYPCIKLYNDKIGGDQNSTSLWLALERDFEIEKYLSYDANVYKNLCKLIKRNIDNGAKLYGLENHEDIITELKKDSNYETNLYNVTNIDFHHDIYYREEDRVEAKYFDKSNCSDWFGYLIDNKKVASDLRWIKAPNSEPCHIEDFMSKLTVDNITNDFRSNKVFTDIDYQYIYLVKSPQWVPHKFIHLYDLIIDLFGDENKEV